MPEPLVTKCLLLHRQGTFYLVDDGMVAELSLRSLDDVLVFNARLGACTTADERRDVLSDLIVAVSHAH